MPGRIVMKKKAKDYSLPSGWWDNIWIELRAIVEKALQLHGRYTVISVGDSEPLPMGMVRTKILIRSNMESEVEAIDYSIDQLLQLRRRITDKKV